MFKFLISSVSTLSENVPSSSDWKCRRHPQFLTFFHSLPLSPSARPVDQWSPCWSCLPLIHRAAKEIFKCNACSFSCFKTITLAQNLNSILSPRRFCIISSYLFSLPHIFLFAHGATASLAFWSLQWSMFFHAFVLLDMVFSTWNTLPHCSSHPLDCWVNVISKSFPNLIPKAYVSHSYHFFGSFARYPIYDFLSYFYRLNSAPTEI